MLSQVSDKTKPFAQLKQPVNRKPLQKEELRNKRANAATSTITKQTRNRGRREGINRAPPPPTNSERVSEELSRARKFKLKVHQRSERRRRVGTAISTSAVCPRAHQQGRVCVHSAHTVGRFTDKQQKAVVFPDTVQTTENYTGRSSAALVSLFSWLRKKETD